MTHELISFQVKDRTSVQYTYTFGSHVMQYGDVAINVNRLFSYIGSNPANDNLTFTASNSLHLPSKMVNQRDADLLFFWNKVKLKVLPPLIQALVLFFCRFPVSALRREFPPQVCRTKGINVNDGPPAAHRLEHGANWVESLWTLEQVVSSGCSSCGSACG